MAGSYFREIYLMGNGSVAAKCAALLSRYFVFFKFFETKAAISPFLMKRLEAAKTPRELFDNAKLHSLTESSIPTLILSVNNNVIFPPSLLANPEITIINYHNSLLPRHRGVHAEAWSIFEGDAQSGVTWHLVDRGIDTGKIICQQSLSITENTTSIELLRKQSMTAINLLEQRMEAILSKSFKLIPNIVQENKSFHYRKDIPGNGFLNIAWPSKKIWRFLRAMDYGPYNNLGLPRLKLGSNIYSWHNYSQQDEITEDSTKNIIHENGKIIINNKILLHNIFKI